jgi:glutamate-1-semialdehyde 2,1-aminomutase
MTPSLELRHSVLVPGAQDYLRFSESAEFPAFVRSSKGAHLVSMEGTLITDLYCGSGAVILGHGDKQQVDYLRRNLDHGASVSLRHPIELSVALKLHSLIPGVDRWMFFKTGSECVHLALRVAREHTGRKVIISFGYHGWVAPFGFPRQEMKSVDLVECGWNVEAARLQIREVSGSLAAVIVSPSPYITDPSFYSMLREESERCGALLIMDEIKSGFRWMFPCLSHCFDLRPDLLLLSKAIANGFPIAALGGRSDLLDNKEKVSVFSTFANENMSLFAAMHCLQRLESGAYQEFATATTRFHGLLTEALRTHEIQLIGTPTFFRLELPACMDRVDVAVAMWKDCILFHPKDEVLLTAAHNDPSLLSECAEHFVSVLSAALSAS